MISSVTLNPSLDTVVVVEDLASGEVNRSRDIFTYPAGKGVDAARTVKNLGGEVRCLCLLPRGVNGKVFKELLDAEGISGDFISVDGDMRTNLLLENTKLKQETIILQNSKLVLFGNTMDELTAKVREYAARSSIVIFSGSVPAGLPESVYFELINCCHESGAKAILDSSGSGMLMGVGASPFMIKPNLAEFEELAGSECASPNDVVSALKHIPHYGISLVVVSLGKDGLVFKYQNDIFRVPPLPANAISYAGAGDTLVGGIALGLSRGLSVEDSMRIGVAAATASLSQYGSSFFDIFEFNGNMKDIEITRA